MVGIDFRADTRTPRKLRFRMVAIRGMPGFTRSHMHQLPTQGIVRRYRFAALCVVLKWILISVSSPCLIYAVMIDRRDIFLDSIGMLLAAGCTTIGHLIGGMRARCPLCFVPSFSHQQQSKNSRALRFLGSYRVFVAFSVLFRGWFQCPYCGEKTSIKARQRKTTWLGDSRFDDRLRLR